MVFVVVAHYNKDTSWTKNLKYPSRVITKSGIPYETPPNRGNEASSYLQYIIEEYDNLDDITIFVHDHRSDWHHKENIDEAINRMIFDKPYYNFNTNDMGNALTELTRFPQEMNRMYLHTPFFEKLLGLKIDPTQIVYRNSAQFYVTKDTIRQYPKEIYLHMYIWLMSTPEISWMTSRVFEYLWHVIFTRNMVDVK